MADAKARAVFAFWLSCQYAWASPLPLDIPAPSSTAAYDPNPSSSSNPFADPSNQNNNSPTTTIVIVSVVGSLALIGGIWGVYSCVVARRKPKISTMVQQSGSGEPATAIICIPGETFPTTAMPALCYNSPHTQPYPEPEVVETGPGVVLPPPPSYGAVIEGRELDLQSIPVPCTPSRTRSESRWKDLLISQGRS